MNPLRHFLHDLAALPPDLKLLAVSLFAWASGESLFIYIIPLYLKQLGATPVQIGNVASLAAVASACTMIPAGLLTDRWGPKRVLSYGWLVGVATGGFMALAWNLPTFALGWIAYSLTLFVIPPVASYAIAGRGALPPERALTMTSAGYALGNVISPAVGGWIAEEFGLRSLFAIGTMLFAISTVVLHFVRPQPVTRAAAGGDFRGLLANRRFVGFCLLTLGVWIVLWLGIPLAPNYLADVRGLTVAQVNRLGSFNALGWVVLGLVLGRRPPRRAFLIAQGFVMLYLLILLRTPWTGLIAVAFFARGAIYVSHSLVNAQATRVVEPSQWGLAFGVLETVAWIGAVVAPLLAGRLYEIQPALPFQLGLVLLPLALLVTYLFAPRPQALARGPSAEATQTGAASGDAEAVGG